jgi:uncharacterized protein (DUF924 family)
MASDPSWEDVLRFWFEEVSPPQWWTVDPAFDRQIAERFADVHARATRAELHAWRAEPAGRLAEIIVVDQFSRNMHRGDAAAFAHDMMAVVLTQEAVAAGADLALPVERRSFLYMPLMHSESRVIHEVAERLFRERATQNSHAFELRHKAIIDRFGRYPHRNEVLGRVSTPEERDFLTQPGSRF